MLDDEKGLGRKRIQHSFEVMEEAYCNYGTAIEETINFVKHR